MGCVCVFLSRFFSTLEVLHLRVTPVGHFASTDSELPPQKKAGEMILEASGPFLKKLAGPDRAWSLAASLHQSLSSPAETGNPFFSAPDQRNLHMYIPLHRDGSLVTPQRRHAASGPCATLPSHFAPTYTVHTPAHIYIPPSGSATGPACMLCIVVACVSSIVMCMCNVQCHVHSMLLLYVYACECALSRITGECVCQTLDRTSRHLSITAGGA